jgi:hypothetical protein
VSGIEFRNLLRFCQGEKFFFGGGGGEFPEFWLRLLLNFSDAAQSFSKKSHITNSRDKTRQDAGHAPSGWNQNLAFQIRQGSGAVNLGTNHCHKKAGMPPGIPAQSTSRSAAHHGETSRKKPAAFVPSVFV